MRKLGFALAVLTLLASSAPTPAQWIIGKKPRANPSQRVPELILTVKTDADERKRALAAEELRDFDSITFSEIVPVLVDVLKNDKKPNVRLEALNSLAKIRPVTGLAGQAIEKAAADDEAWRVRWQARASLPKYQLAGYVSKKAPAAKTSSFEEPPLADPLPRVDAPQRIKPPTNATPPRPLPQTVAPPKSQPRGPSLDP